jgi:uncharacterized OB-fold protein
MPPSDQFGNAARTCWRCGDEHGIHRVRCPECDAHRDMAWVKEQEEKETNDAQLVQ